MRHFLTLAAAAALIAGCGSGSGTGGIVFNEAYSYGAEFDYTPTPSAYQRAPGDPLVGRDTIVRFEDITAVVQLTDWDNNASVDRFDGDGGHLDVYLTDHPRADLQIEFVEGTQIRVRDELNGDEEMIGLDQLNINNVRVDIHRQVAGTGAGLSEEEWFDAAKSQVANWENHVFRLNEEYTDTFQEASGYFTLGDDQPGGGALAMGTIYHGEDRGLGWGRFHAHIDSGDDPIVSNYTAGGWTFNAGWSMDIEVEARDPAESGQ